MNNLLRIQRATAVTSQCASSKENPHNILNIHIIVSFLYANARNTNCMWCGSDCATRDSRRVSHPLSPRQPVSLAARTRED
jgi:hypothetical protein